MTNLTLESLSYGWERADTPDNIEYILRTEEGEQFEMMASLQQLAILYDSVANENDSHFYMGTGTPVKVENSDGKTEITFGNIRIAGNAEKLSEYIGELLREVFRELDRQGTSEARERCLKQIDQHLQEYYSGTDFKLVYENIV